MYKYIPEFFLLNYLISINTSKFPLSNISQVTISQAVSISNIKLSVLITEKQDTIRLSLRSKDDFSVNDMSRKHFNGGGHLNAAGGTLTCTLEEAVAKFKSVLPEYKHVLGNETNEC